MPQPEIFPEVTLPASIRLESNGHPLGELDPSAIQALTGIALRNLTSYNSAIESAVINEAFILEQEAQGGQILIKKGNTIQQLWRSN